MTAGIKRVTMHDITENHHCIGSEGARSVVAVTGECDDDLSPVSAADARRLAACWNACAGLTTEVLENIDALGDTLLSRIEALKEEANAASATLAAVRALLAKGDSE